MPALVPLEGQRPVTGWVVLSEQFYRSGLHFSFRRESCAPHAHYRFHVDPRDAFDWLCDKPADFQRRPGGWPETRYEAKARTLGHEVWYFRFKRK